MSWLIGVDVGGTFTDFCALEQTSGKMIFHKIPSTPANPARAILDGAVAMCDANGISAEHVIRLGHGTTVATNALIQRKGGRVGLITTKGFRDVLEIGRQVRPKQYSLQEDYPAPLVPRARRFELNERVGSMGQVHIRPSDDEIEDVVRKVVETGVDACAIGLLFSFLNPECEQRVAETFSRIAPRVPLSLSSKVQPEFREYERLSTTVLNAYLLSVMSQYMQTLENEFSTRFPNASIGVNQSSGGLMSVSRARRFPVRTALSGPAAGVVGASYFAKLSGRRSVITLDMGGTSADVALIRDYRADVSFERSIEDFPVRLPSIDINSVGAGGGSVAWFDRDDLMKVGPESAGSVPGPACYDLGGEKPTVSDANLVLGRLSRRGLLGGKMPLNLRAAQNALAPIADQLGFSLERAAHGIISIVTANMVRAIRGISVERGLDPRDFSLVAFGGAGPLQARDVARGLGMREIVVPLAPGILCAQGLVVADQSENFVRTIRIKLDRPGAGEVMVENTAELLARARAWLSSEDISTRTSHSLELSCDMRYVGQNYELSVELLESDWLNLDINRLTKKFFETHQKNYGYFNENDPVEVINLRLSAKARHEVPERISTNDPQHHEAEEDSRPIFFDHDAPVDSAIHYRETLKVGDIITGPAVIEQMDATTLIFPGDRGRIDEALNLNLEVMP
ncbi:MAG: methylhydantoinase [Rhodospirillaceae bacterium]|nr:methylhydantoinase [Rhodospirillaceae bacterium]